MMKNGDLSQKCSNTGIWITWEKQIRNRGLSEALNFKLYEMVCDKTCLKRYITLIVKTIQVIIKEKPPIVVAQNPSIVLAILVVGLKKIFDYIVIIDAHNGGLKPKDGKIKILNLAARLLQKKADITLVTNEALKKDVERNGGFAHILHDKIPVVTSNEHYKFDGHVNIVYICTFADDEPYEEVITSASRIPNNYYLYITGNNKKMKGDIEVSENVKLVGYVPEKEYWSLLHGADIIMDLTTRDNCLVCGAYEGVAFGKPLILSNTFATKEYFSAGCIYVDPTVDSIVDGIIECVNKKNILLGEQIDLKSKLENEWLAEIGQLKIKMVQK